MPVPASKPFFSGFPSSFYFSSLWIFTIPRHSHRLCPPKQSAWLSTSSHT